MTGKRFKLKYINEQHISANLYDNKTFIGSMGIGGEIIIELLNSLSEENEQLKQEMGELGRVHAEEINKIEDDFDDEILKLEKKNERLKNICKTLIYQVNKRGITVTMTDNCKELLE